MGYLFYKETQIIFCDQAWLGGGMMAKKENDIMTNEQLVEESKPEKTLQRICCSYGSRPKHIFTKWLRDTEDMLRWMI